MRRAQVQGAILILILLVAFIGTYFIFKGVGHAAIAPPISVVISGEVAFPSGFDIRAPLAYVLFVNEGAVRQEVAVYRYDKKVLGFAVNPGDVKKFSFRRGEYSVLLIGKEE